MLVEFEKFFIFAVLKLIIDMSAKHLFRLQSNKLIAGVCCGIARYFNIDASIVRILWIVLTLMGGAGILAYLICWLVIPQE